MAERVGLIAMSDAIAYLHAELDTALVGDARRQRDKSDAPRLSRWRRGCLTLTWS